MCGYNQNQTKDRGIQVCDTGNECTEIGSAAAAAATVNDDDNIHDDDSDDDGNDDKDAVFRPFIACGGPTYIREPQKRKTLVSVIHCYMVLNT